MEVRAFFGYAVKLTHERHFGTSFIANFEASFNIFGLPIWWCTMPLISKDGLKWKPLAADVDSMPRSKRLKRKLKGCAERLNINYRATMNPQMFRFYIDKGGEMLIGECRPPFHTERFGVNSHDLNAITHPDIWATDDAITYFGSKVEDHSIYRSLLDQFRSASEVVKPIPLLSKCYIPRQSQ